MDATVVKAGPTDLFLSLARSLASYTTDLRMKQNWEYQTENVIKIKTYS